MLSHSVKNLNVLTARASSVSALHKLVQAGQGDLLELCIAVLCLGNSKLLKDLRTLLDQIASPVPLADIDKYCHEVSEPAGKAD